MRGWQLVAFAMIASQLCWAQNEPARWAVDPADPGPDAPPVGRSLFDFVATVDSGGKRTYDVPFPFERLVSRLEERAGCTPRERCVKQVLIPLGRSLQRLAAAPEFFKHPRAVAAIDSESARETSPLLKDRVYLGYQEQAALVEVISYNEVAGRFEFQIVRDYRLGGTPQVIYARRAVCAACHQNLAPLFSQPLWEETNANGRVAARLERERAAFYGVPVRRGVDIPDAIDAATGRANWLGVWQRLWSEGCGADGTEAVRCRAAAFTAALQYRLTGERAFDDRSPAWREGLQAPLMREWRARWPGGLAIPSPDIPNRDPLPYASGREPAGAAIAHVAAAFEPLQPRAPLETWAGDRPDTVRRFVGGLAGFLTAADVRALDAHLAKRATGAERRAYEAPCDMEWTRRWLRFKCASTGDTGPQRLLLEGRLDLGGRSITGELNALAAGDGVPLEQFEIKSGAVDLNAVRLTFTPASHGLRARLAGGNAVERIELRWRAPDVRVRGEIHAVAARASVYSVDDFAPVREAVAGMTNEGDFAARPFSRAALLARLFARLGLASREWCCDDASRLPPAAVEPKAPTAPEGAARAYAAFYPHCAICHATSERFPPNFLAGAGERVVANIRQCAPRIYVRLALWHIAPTARDKTPMPPPFPSATATDDRAPAGVDGLERTIAELLRAEQGSAPGIEQLLAGGYEALRPCLLEPK
jgi:mono/diheme cytochrome c family protein